MEQHRHQQRHARAPAAAYAAFTGSIPNAGQPMHYGISTPPTDGADGVRGGNARDDGQQAHGGAYGGGRNGDYRLLLCGEKFAEKVTSFYGPKDPQGWLDRARDHMSGRTPLNDQSLVWGRTIRQITKDDVEKCLVP